MATLNDILLGANKLLQKDDFAEASKLYMLLINEAFENEEVFYNRAICEADLGNYEEAFIASNLVLKLNPNLEEMLHFRAVASWMLNNFELANSDFEKAIKLGDKSAEDTYREFTKSQVLTV